MGLRSPTLVLTAMCVLAAHLPSPTSAQETTASIVAMRVVPDSAAVSRSAPSFDWPAVLSLDAQLRVEYAGPTPGRASLLATVRSQGGELLAKRKADYQLDAGTNELTVEKLLATTDVLGRRLVTLEIELSVRGAPKLRRELDFAMSGPPPPAAAVRELKIYDPREGSSPLSAFDAETLSTVEPRFEFGVGDNFGIEAIIEVTDNPAGLRPRLRIMAVMDEDTRESGFGLPRQSHTLHFDERLLDEKAEGPLRVRATARLPYYFFEPWAHNHPFTVRVELLFGGRLGGEPGSVAASAEVRGAVFDYRPGDARRSDDLQLRLIGISRGPTWTVVPALLPEPDGGLYQPPY